MTESEVLKNANVLLETRITKVEINNTNMAEDIIEIKRNLRWLLGLVFSLNTTIIGLLAKGFNIL